MGFFKENLSKNDQIILKLLYLKEKRNISNIVFDEILDIISLIAEGTEHQIKTSLYLSRKRLQQLVSIKPRHYDCCINGCICFTGEYQDLQQCRICKEDRYYQNGKPKQKFAYFSPLQQIRIQMLNENFRNNTKYRHNHKEKTTDPLHGICDYFDGKDYKILVDEECFQNVHDMAFSFSTDGLSVFVSYEINFYI